MKDSVHRNPIVLLRQAVCFIPDILQVKKEKKFTGQHSAQYGREYLSYEIKVYSQIKMEAIIPGISMVSRNYFGTKQCKWSAPTRENSFYLTKPYIVYRLLQARR